jgi:outer membrane protein OmpA-like peptidoglycan-associated protein
LELLTAGVGESIKSLPISGSVGASDYVNFKTPREVNFFDFDGTWTTVREINVGVYSWTGVSLWGMTVNIADGGLNIQGIGVSSGKANIIFGSGKTLDVADLEVPRPSISPEPQPFKQHAKDDAYVYRIPGDILFAFNKYHLKPGRRTDTLLASIGNSLHAVDDWRFLVVGHTDSIGSHEFNRKLSKRRAETVASWFNARKFVPPGWMKALGVGKTEPMASNDTKEGRAQNRRVEVVGMRRKQWEAIQ